MTKKKTAAKANIPKKPLNLQAEKGEIEVDVRKRLKAEKEKIITTLLTQIVYTKKVAVGVGNEKEFYEQLENGFKEVLSAKGIRVNETLAKEIEDNDGRLIAKENLPRIENLSRDFGIVPNQ